MRGVGNHLTRMAMSVNKLTCFKSYDIQGKVGNELNEDIAYRMGHVLL